MNLWGLNKELAARLAEERLTEWLRHGYDEWRVMLDDKELRLVVGVDGKEYAVVSYAIEEGDGQIRMCVAVDDGGWSAWAPLVRVKIMNSDGTFLA